MQFAMEKWQEARRSLRETNDKITAMNREVLEQLVTTLSADAAWQLKLAYNQAAYPEIFRDDRSAEKTIQAALSLPDIDATLKEIQYAYDTLNSDGLGLFTSYGDQWLGSAAFRPVMEELEKN